MATAATSRNTGSSAPSGPRRWPLPVAGLLVTPLTTLGLSGVDDAPDPHDSAASMAAHFVELRDGILAAAVPGYLGAGLMVAVALGLGREVWRRGERGPAMGIAIGGAVVAMYFALGCT
jgi:hypothetical protein